MSHDSQNSFFKHSNEKSKSSQSRSPLHKITKIKSQSSFPIAQSQSQHHIFDQNRFENNLSQSIKQASEIFEHIIIDYPHPVKDPLSQLQYLIQIKKDQVEKVNSQLMELKNVNDSINGKKHKTIMINPQDGLVRDINQRKEQLLEIKESYKQKLQQYQTKKKQLKQRQQHMLKISTAKDSRCLTYQQFLQHKRKTNKKSNTSKQKRIVSIKQPPVQQEIQPQQYNSKKQKLLQKKQILENALETSKKKFLKEVEQLTEQIQFLRQQNSILQSKIDLKQQEKRQIQMKLAPRKNISTSRNKLTSLKNYI